MFFVLFLIVHYVVVENNMDLSSLSNVDGLMESSKPYLVCGAIALLLTDILGQKLWNKPKLLVEAPF